VPDEDSADVRRDSQCPAKRAEDRHQRGLREVVRGQHCRDVILIAGGKDAADYRNPERAADLQECPASTAT
jgi:hypothetical protein